MLDAADYSVKAQKLVSPGKADRIERDARHSASSSGIDTQGAVAVPDFTPLRNGSGCVFISIVFLGQSVHPLSQSPPGIFHCGKRLRQVCLLSGLGLGQRRQISTL